MREKRLSRDFQVLSDLHQASDLINIELMGDQMDTYRVIYYCKSLIWVDNNKTPSLSKRHEMEIYLHKEYPRRPPIFKWLTNIFHPNILPPHKNGGVCIGWWTAAETLDSLCIRIGEMLQYKVFNLTDPLNEEAANWASRNKHLFPIDDRCFY